MQSIFGLVDILCDASQPCWVISFQVQFITTPLKMLVFSLRQNGFRRIESLLPSPNRAQRMVQTRKSSALSEINVSDDITFPKRVDSLWKVGAHVSAAGGMENTVTNAANIGSVIHR